MSDPTYPEYAGDEYDAGYKAGYNDAWDKCEPQLRQLLKKVGEYLIERPRNVFAKNSLEGIYYQCQICWGHSEIGQTRDEVPHQKECWEGQVQAFFSRPEVKKIMEE